MKTIIILFLVIGMMSSCNNSNSKTEVNPDLKGISWESEKLSEYQLIRPINYSKDAKDAYHLPIREGQWYLISMYSDCYLLPVFTEDAMGPNFVENAIRWNKIAIMDTMFTGFMSNSKKFNGLDAIHTMEIVCFQHKWSVEPSVLPSGQMTVVTKKRE